MSQALYSIDEFNAARKGADEWRALEQLTKAVAERFATDPSTAGISLAYLGAKGWYGSICRYTERLGRGKQVVLKAKRETLEDCISELERQWRDYITLVEPSRGCGVCNYCTARYFDAKGYKRATHEQRVAGNWNMGGVVYVDDKGEFVAMLLEVPEHCVG